MAESGEGEPLEKHISTFLEKVSAAAEANKFEWFRCLSQIRPEVPTPIILATIYAVLTEITYVALRIDELQLKEDIRPILQRIAWAGLMS